MNSNFWLQLNKPIIALAPMDGVTDAAFRYMCDIYGKPAVLFTEFTSAEGIDHGIAKLLLSFVSHTTDTATVGQIFGNTPAAFYRAAFVLCEMGFDGIDINMGCPAKSVYQKGAGAGLIKNPKLAQELIITTKQAIQDWTEGRSIESVGLKSDVLQFIAHYKSKNSIKPVKRIIPLSIKTRIGYDEIVTEWWISTLLETKPVAISLHGRTLKQLYSGLADWEEIGKAALLARKAGTLLLGNGDIKSISEANEKIATYKTDGALIGRASFGNPWIFTGETADIATKLTAALKHSEAFMNLTPELNFLSLRKHMSWYCKGFEDAAQVRLQLMHTQNIEEIKKIIKPFINTIKKSSN